MALALFYIFAVAAVVCALAMVFVRNPVYSALYLIGTLIAIAGEFVLLDSPLLAALQVLVYAGAIMVLYLFVIMLLNLKREKGFRALANWRTYVGLGLTGLVGATAVWKFMTLPNPENPVVAFTPKQVAARMFTDPTQVLLIEALAVLLLMAVVGAVYLGGKSSVTEARAAEEPKVPAPGEAR